MAGDILGFATKSSKNKPAAVLSSNGTQKNIDQIKKNAGQLADVVGSGADDSYKQFVSSQSKKQQQKQVVEPAQPQSKPSTSLLSKVVKTSEKVGKGTANLTGQAARAVARPVIDVASGQGGKAAHDSAQLSSDLTGGSANYLLKTAIANPIKETAAQVSGNKKAQANATQQSNVDLGLGKSGKDIKHGLIKTGAEAALAASNVVGGGEVAGAKGALKAGASLTAKRVAKDAAIGAVAGGSGTVASDPQATAKDIAKNAAIGGLIGGAAPGVISLAGDAGRAAAEKLGVGGKAAAKSLLDWVRSSQGVEPELPAEPTLSQSGEVIAPSKPELHPDTAKALHDTMATVHQPKAALEADAAKQAATEAAGKQSEQAAKDAEKATADTKKIDQQLEVYDAKAKDAKDGKLSNVDQVKVKQLKEQKAEVAQKLPQQSTNVLYHGTSADNALSILTDGKIKATAKPLDNRLSGGDKSLDDVRTVSLSRTAEGASQRGGNTAEVHFIFDRDTLRNNAKLTPFSKRGFTKTELEERADRDIPISKATAVQVSGNVSPEQLAQIKAAAEKHGILVKTDADTPAKPIPEATPSVKPESTPAKPEAAKSASEAPSAKDTPATESEQKANTKPAKETPTVAAPRTLTPSETAHMEPIGGYTHSKDMVNDYADYLREYEKQQSGGNIERMDGQDGVSGQSTYKRTTTHSKFYREFYAENGKPPTKADWLEEAKRHLEAGSDAFGAGEDYKKLLERESKPLPRANFKPQVTGESRTSGSAMNAEAKAVQKHLAREFKDKASYSGGSFKDEAIKADNLVKNDPQKAMDIAIGKLPGDNTIHEVAVARALEDKALQEGDVETLRALANSPRHTATSEAAQRLGAEGFGEQHSVVKNLAAIKKVRQDSFEKRNKTKVAQATNEEIKQIRAAKPKVTKETFASFVDSLKC